MSKRFYYVFILLFITINFLFAQKAELVWINSFGGSESEVGRDTEQTADGGFLTLGYTKSFGNGGWDIILVKTDYYGSVQWYKTYGGNSDDCAYSMNSTSDGGFIIGGYNSSVYSNANLWIIKTDAYGDTLWSKIYNYYQSSFANSVLKTEDGGFIITGSANIPEIGENVLLIKTDSKGDTSWSKIYKLAHTNSSSGYSVKQTNDNGYIVTGRSSNDSGEDIFLIKADAQGDTIWSKIYNVYDHDYSSEVIQTYDGGYVLTGYAMSLATGNSNMINMKMDSQGNILWKSILGLEEGSSGSGIIQTSDSNFVVLGTSGVKLLIIGLSQNGDSLWTNIIDDSAYHSSSSIKIIENGEYIFSGSIKKENEDYYDILFGRFSSNPIKANFSADKLEGSLPLVIQFQDSSSNNVIDWKWDFDNDGIIDSELQNPTWTIMDSDTYSVKLIVNNESLADTMVKENYIKTYFNTIPVLFSIEDIPNDQGGWVRVKFLRSAYDTDTLSLAKTSGTELYTVEIYDSSGWNAANSTVAYGKYLYSVLVPTTKDSTSESNGLFDFRIIAGMDEGNFVSHIMRGYSVDNLHPSIPQGLVGDVTQEENIKLTWLPVLDKDFKYYRIYRRVDGTSFVLIASTIDTVYIDNTVVIDNSYYYTVKAVDHSYNESDFSNIINISVTDITTKSSIPTHYYLSQNYPNPFNPQTTIKYGLLRRSDVRIVIYDILGHKINELINATQNPGHHQVIWNGKNNSGQVVSTGIYYYKLETTDFKEMRKMLFVR